MRPAHRVNSEMHVFRRIRHVGWPVFCRSSLLKARRGSYQPVGRYHAHVESSSPLWGLSGARTGNLKKQKGGTRKPRNWVGCALIPPALISDAMRHTTTAYPGVPNC